MYRNAWPLLAFATYRKILERTAVRIDGETNTLKDGAVYTK
jgi:hypothetical protein